MKMNKPGFSLAEILIALFIVAVVGTLGSMGYSAYKKYAQRTTAEAQLKAIKGAIGLYETQVGDLPETLNDLIKPPADEKKAARWDGEYIEKKQLKDPWRRSYQYKPTPDEEHPYELYSNGPKGKADKKGRISVWDL